MKKRQWTSKLITGWVVAEHEGPTAIFWLQTFRHTKKGAIEAFEEYTGAKFEDHNYPLVLKKAILSVEEWKDK